MINSLPAITGFAPVGDARALNSPAGSAAQTPDFAQVLAQVSSDAIGTVKAGEAAAISGIQGKASVQEVVEAIMSAEQTLQTAIAVRDKVVAAYQEISRMSV